LGGLVTIKELLDEGHRVTCFEREAREGGNFNYPTGSAYETMYLTTSQYFTAFPPFLLRWTRSRAIGHGRNTLNTCTTSLSSSSS
jgi:cation diffusion facilitator CzcD-associated flavoprotein CzcO